jgi:uncharacterized membrane protein YcaP (DUF421 family)
MARSGVAMSSEMFFNGWDVIVRTLVIGALAYLALIFILRVSGKRTLSKWNAFDFVVTIALGSSLATALLSKQVSLAQGVLGLALLIFLQLLATWLNVRLPVVQKLLKARPTLLLYQGQFQHEVMRRERVPEQEVRAAIRANGIPDVEKVGAVVLETTGEFTVIEDLSGAHGSALMDVEGFSELHEKSGAEGSK